MYLGWQDDSRKPVADKIAGAIAAYQERFGYAPTVVLCSAADDPPQSVDGVTVQTEGYVRRNNFWVGQVER